METLVKLEGVPEDVLKVLVKKGYFKTKTEAIRAGILAIGKEYAVLKDLELQLVALKIASEEAEMKSKGERYLSEEEVAKKYRLK